MDDKVKVTPQGDYADTSEITTAAGVVHRQRFSLADDSDPNEHAIVEDGALHVHVTNQSAPVGIQDVNIAAQSQSVATTVGDGFGIAITATGKPASNARGIVTRVAGTVAVDMPVEVVGEGGDPLPVVITNDPMMIGGNLAIKDESQGNTARVLPYDPQSTTDGLVTRNIPSGTQNVAIPDATFVDDNFGVPFGAKPLLTRQSGSVEINSATPVNVILKDASGNTPDLVDNGYGKALLVQIDDTGTLAVSADNIPISYFQPSAVNNGQVKGVVTRPIPHAEDVARHAELVESLDAMHQSLIEKLPRTIAQEMARHPPYARDINDALRVALQAGSTTTIAALNFGTSNSVPGWYSTGSPNGMDAREQARIASKTNFLLTRQRWTIS